MPRISVNLADVETYEGLPVGSYLATIESITHQEPQKEGKYPQLKVTYQVIDGDHLGSRSSEWVSLSPKAAFRLKRWFDRFGLGDVEDLDVDDDTSALLEPDLLGVNVIFKVYQDGYKENTNPPEPRFRTELVSVEDDVAPAAPAAMPSAEAAQAEAAPAAAAPATRTATARPGRPANAAPQRRTLR